MRWAKASMAAGPKASRDEGLRRAPRAVRPKACNGCRAEGCKGCKGCKVQGAQDCIALKAERQKAPMAARLNDARAAGQKIARAECFKGNSHAGFKH